MCREFLINLKTNMLKFICKVVAIAIQLIMACHDMLYIVAPSSFFRCQGGGILLFQCGSL
jgi:hypothetical protein